jgi:alpha-beta hydrolase superfamily lysophospholipase
MLDGLSLFRIACVALACLLLPLYARGQTVTEEAWSAGGLHGTLLHSADRAAHGPAVLIVAGSGPTDRDGNGPGLSTDTYKMLAQGFAAHGIATLRYDKRGVGGSRALAAHEENLRFGDFVDDAVVAARALAARPDISGIVIVGHSEGALIALMLAQQTDVAGVILLAAPGRPLAAVLREQLQTALPDALRREAFAILDKLTAEERVADVRPELSPLFRPSVHPFLMSVLGIDPAVEIVKVRQPVLLMQAGRDLQIAQSDLEALRKARPDMRLVVLPEANHVLKTSPADRAGNIAMYGNRTAPLDPGVMPPLIDFVRSITK